jgi:hypothetical protein
MTYTLMLIAILKIKMEYNGVNDKTRAIQKNYHAISQTRGYTQALSTAERKRNDIL